MKQKISRISFNIYEAALLLQACLNVLLGKISRNKAIQECSLNLRRMALNEGKDISNSYRSESGIRGRMASMESAYQGNDSSTPISPLFKKIVNIYKNNNEKFKEILNEAKEKVNIKEIHLNLAAIPNNMEYTKPKEISYFKDVRAVSFWNELYVKVCQFLFEDYPHIFKKMRTESLMGVSTPWITDGEHKDLLRIPREVVQDYFVETNYSAVGHIKNIKWLLDQCDVDYENIKITYVYKMKKSHVIHTDLQETLHLNTENENQRQKFYDWLKYNQHKAENTCNGYVSAIGKAEQFAQKNRLKKSKLFTDDIDEAKETAELLLKNKWFIWHNKDKHNIFSAAIKNLLDFYNYNQKLTTSPTAPSLKTIDTNSNENVFDKNIFTKIIAEYYPQGYRLNSIVEFRRLCEYFEKVTGNKITLEKTELENFLPSCGIFYDGILYIPEILLSEGIKNKIFSYIDEYFDKGNLVLYYKDILQTFDKELHNKIYDVCMLKLYLEYYLAHKYYIHSDFLSK